MLVSRKTSIYWGKTISIGDNVRIDDFCILFGHIKIGSNIHISAYCGLYGQCGIIMEDYTGLSPRVTVLSSTDDFGGDYLIGPMLPDSERNVIGGTITIKKYTHIGTHSVIMPGVVIKEGVAVGAMSFVNRNLDSWGVYCGTPVRRIKDRKKGLLKLIHS